MAVNAAHPLQAVYESVLSFAESVEALVTTSTYAKTEALVVRPEGGVVYFWDWWRPSEPMAMEIYAHTTWVVSERGELTMDLFEYRLWLLVESGLQDQPNWEQLDLTRRALVEAVACSVIRNRLLVTAPPGTAVQRADVRANCASAVENYTAMVVEDEVAAVPGPHGGQQRTETRAMGSPQVQLDRFMKLFWGFAAGAWLDHKSIAAKFVANGVLTPALALNVTAAGDRSETRAAYQAIRYVLAQLRTFTLGLYRGGPGGPNLVKPEVALFEDGLASSAFLGCQLLARLAALEFAHQRARVLPTTAAARVDIQAARVFKTQFATSLSQYIAELV